MRNKGMLWKTPWKRRKPVVPPNPKPMWFFTNFGPTGSVFDSNSGYYFANPSPCPGDGAGPFWAGMVAAFALKQAESEPVVAERAIVLGQGWSLADDVLKSLGGPISLVANSGGAFGISADVDQLGAVYRAVMSLITCVPDGLGSNVLKLYVDGVYRAQRTQPYVATGNPMRMGTPDVFGGDPLVHGWAGGNSLLTSDEILAWFKNTKKNLEIAEIPGKTSDRITATSVAPLAPLSIPNLAGGQSMDYVVNLAPDPVAKNVLIPVSFAY